MVSHEDKSTPSEPECDPRALVRAAIKQLVSEGVVHMVGRTSAGQPIWGLTEAPPLSARIRRWSLHRFRLILLFPSLVIEHAAWRMAVVLTLLFGEPPQLALTLADLSERLCLWCNCFPEPMTTWLSVKPEND
jgi:hypothetical protein